MEAVLEESTTCVREASVKLAETELLRCMPSVRDTNSLGSRIPSEVTGGSLSVTISDGCMVVDSSLRVFLDNSVISSSAGSNNGPDCFVVT